MGFWSGDDIQDRVGSGLLVRGASAARSINTAQRSEQRSPTFCKRAVCCAMTRPTRRRARRLGYCFLAENDEEFLLINLEDLWLEPGPQNVPGTWQERPNWQRKARLSLETICASPAPSRKLLKRIGDIRGADKIK